MTHGSSVENNAGSVVAETPHRPIRPRPWAAAFTIVCAAFLTLVLPLAAPTLNGLGIGGLPLGYYLAAQGGLLLVALLGLWLSGPWNRTARGQRLSAFLASLTACGSWLTAGTVLTLTGALFVYGHDGLPLYLGLSAGLLVSLVFIAPALDRAGALHVDDLLGRVTGSAFTAAAAGLGMAAGLVILVSIEMEVAGLAVAAAAGEQGGQTPAVIGGVAALAAFLSFTPGRRFWYALLAVALVALASVIWTLVWGISGKLPVGFVPQLAYGQALSELTVTERALLVEGLGDPLSMPPFARPFVQVSQLNFVVLTLSMLLGAAVLPHMLWRRRTAAADPSNEATWSRDAFPSRHKAAFGLVVAAVILTALPAAAVFTKLELYQKVAAGLQVKEQPKWLQQAQQAGYMRVCRTQAPSDIAPDADNATAASEETPAACGDTTGRLRIVDLAINPGAVVLLMPAFAGFSEPKPSAFAALIGLLAVLASAATLRMTVEVSTGWLRKTNADQVKAPPSMGLRIPLTIVFAAAATVIVVLLGESPVNRLYWAFAVLGASLFPMLLLAALMPRINGVALALGGLTGLAACLYYVVGTTGIFAPQFALTWASVSDAPPWLLDELRELLQTCASETAESPQACRNALELGPELANWFGIDGRAGAAIGGPLGIVVALVATVLSPSTWRRPV